MGGALGERSGDQDAAVAERGGQSAILLAEKVGQLDMKERNGQTEQNAGELEDHGR